MTNKSRLILLLVLSAICNLSLLSSSAQAWQVSISDCPGCGSRGEAAVVDAAGDVIATGSFFYGSDVVKLSGATGKLIWRYEVMGHESRNYVQDIAIDSHGDVFMVFAWTRVVVKVSGANGTKIWEKPIGGTLNAFLPLMSAVAVDRDDNVITAGTMGGFFNVCKLDGHTGDEKWHYDARGGYARGVAIDRNGDVAAAGMMSNNFATVKLSGRDGRELWHDEINGPGIFSNAFEEARAVAIGPDGSIVVAGVTVDVTGELNDCTKEFTVVKYFPNGTKWTRIINGSLLSIDDHGRLHNGATDEANAVTIDSNGDVVAAGSFQVSPDINVSAPEHFQVFKLSGINGQTIWDSAAEGTPSNQIHAFGRAFALSVDAANDVVATGLHDGRFAVVKIKGAAGIRAWPAHLINSGGLGNGNNAVSVAIDAASNVVAAGEIVGSDGWSKFTVVKLRGITGSNYEVVPEKVLTYAPLVYLYTDDAYRPGDPETFINNSSLRWYHEFGCDSHLIAPRRTVDANRLGGQTGVEPSPYSAHPILPTLNGNSCTHLDSITFTTRNYTRPWDGTKRTGDSSFWENCFYEKEGFYLDLDDNDELRKGIQAIPGSQVYPGAPVFYEYVEGRYITYWFFYPYDEFSFPHLLLGDAPMQFHEGDWERISIQLDCHGNPFNVYYYNHDGGKYAHWNTIDKYEGTHPIVYSAKGSHASYPDEGFHPTSLCIKGRCVNDVTNNGPKWLTWNSLSKVESQPWYGYGGAWGDVNGLREINTPIGSISGAEYTGPLGPDEYKNSSTLWSSPPCPY